MRRIIFQLSFFFFSFLCIEATSQPVNNLFGDVVMPSPNASALGKYTDAPVDLSSGIPQISVPIYNLTQGPLSLPISLDYHASGCKVAETPTWVGTGWALKAGGMVARTVLGVPDEFDAGFYYTGQNLNVAPNLPIPGSLSISILNNTTDGEPDLFFFSFPGYSGYFYIDYLHQPTLVPHQDLVIKFNGNNTLGSSPQTDRFQNFTIITPDGNNYIFGSVTGISGNGFESIENTNFGTSNYRSGWYLMRIESSDGLHKIDFSYEEEKFTYVSQGVSGKDYIDFTNAPCCIPVQPLNYQLDYFINLTSKRLKWIQTTQEKVSFEATSDREDTGVPLGSTIKAKRLDRIKIETFGTPIWCKRFDLDFDYFKVSPTSSNYWEKHLRLLSIQEITCDGLSSKPKELFQYEGDFLPSTLSRAYDHWGYYNATGAGVPPTTLDPDGSGPIPPVTFGSGSRESNETEMKKGVLKKIIYPTGGSVSYTYEANDYKLCTDATPVSLFSFTAPPCHAFDVTSNTISFNSNSLSSLTYKITHTPPSTCGSGVQLNNNYTLQIWNQSNNTLINTYQFNSTTNAILQGDLLTLFPQIQANNFYYFKILTASSEQTFTIYQPCTTYSDIKVGGLRVKEVRINDGINALNDIVKSYSYKGSDGFSSGNLYQIPVYGRILVGPLDNYSISCIYTIPSLTIVRRWTSIPFIPISSFSGRHITYSKVKESSGNNGYTEYEFISKEATPQPNTFFPSIPETIALNLGKQTKNTAVTAYGLTLGVNNTTFNATYLQGNDYFLRVSPVTFSYDCGGIFGTQTNFGNALFSIYTGYSLLTQKESILDGVSTKTTYTYNSDPINFQLAPESEQMTNSDGLISKVEYKYNYTLNDALTRQFLINRNIISQPWGIRKWVSNILVDGSDNEYAFYNLTTGAYQTSSTGAFARLYKQYRYETTWDANGVIIGPNTILKATINSYDSKGFPTSYQATNWLPITYEWNTIGTLKKKIYKDFVWEYTYHPGTQFLSYVKNIDGQETWYDYDEFWRLKKISSRPTTIGNKSSANVYSEFNYQYININNLKNFIKTKITYTPIAGSNIISQESFEYLDGLGRHLQTVGKQQSPNLKDVVTEATEYDPNGRISKVCIPYEVTTGTTGAFTAIPNGTFFSKNIYEPSPLNRLSLITPPDWYPTQVLYGTNAGNEVLVPGTSTYFAPSSLSKTTTILPDPTCSKTGFPNGNRKISFKDKKGRVVLERETNASGTLVADTYTKYDNKDREILVIPPGASASDADLVFKYTYDGEDKTLTKKVPDLGLMTFKYNDRDQLVFEQDGNLAQTSNWQCSRYDDYGRLLKSGLFAGTIPNPIPLSLDPTDNYIENT